MVIAHVCWVHKMKIKNSFLVLLGFLFLVLFSFFIYAEACSEVGKVSATQYCDVDLVWHDLKVNNETCANGYECLNECIDGVCKEKYGEIVAQEGAFAKIWLFISGKECDPTIDTEYKCEGTIAYLCGAGFTWEEKGEIDGVCGYTEEIPMSGGECDPAIDTGYKCDGTFAYLCNESLVWEAQGYIDGVCGYIDVALPCDPLNDTGYACNGTIAYVCNESSVWENKGQIVGVCGYTTGGGGGTSGGGGGTGGGGGSEAGQGFINYSDIEVFCGNKKCQEGENCRTCEEDCGVCIIEEVTSTCGDGVCGPDESSFTCPKDCPVQKKSRLWIYLILVVVIIAIILVIYFIVKKVRARRLLNPAKL